MANSADATLLIARYMAASRMFRQRCLARSDTARNLSAIRRSSLAFTSDSSIWLCVCSRCDTKTLPLVG